MTYADLVKKLRFRLKDADSRTYSDQELVEDIRMALETLAWRMVEVGLSAEWLSDGTLDAPTTATTIDLTDGMASGVVALAQNIKTEDPRIIQAVADIALRMAVTLYGEEIEPDSDELPF